MEKRTAQFSACAFVFCALLLAPAAPAQVLTITSGGRRVIDRDPGSAAGNCLGWTYGASPALGPNGEILPSLVVYMRIVPLVNGSASADLTFIVPGQHLVSAWYDAQGQWDASRAPALAQNVAFSRRRAVRSGS
jgi:hypothetical protein